MPTMKKPIGVIGLGLMGTAITERLLEFGYPVRLWNRTRDKADAFLQRGALWSDNPIADCDRVIISLYSSDVVAHVIDQMQLGRPDGSATSHATQSPQVLIDTTTGEPEDSIALRQRMTARGVTYLDAPISGSSQQTRLGQAMVMVGGDRVTFDACADLWPVLGKQVFYVGDSGSAAKIKLVTNLTLGLNRIALAEGLEFAKAIGVNPEAALEVLQGSAAYSRVMDVKGHKMLTGDFSTQAKLSQHLKDVRIILKLASTAGLELPMSETNRKLLEQAESDGNGELDNSSIIRVYQARSDE